MAGTVGSGLVMPPGAVPVLTQPGLPATKVAMPNSVMDGAKLRRPRQPTGLCARRRAAADRTFAVIAAPVKTTRAPTPLGGAGRIPVSLRSACPESPRACCLPSRLCRPPKHQCFVGFCALTDGVTSYTLLQHKKPSPDRKHRRFPIPVMHQVASDAHQA